MLSFSDVYPGFKRFFTFYLHICFYFCLLIKPGRVSFRNKFGHSPRSSIITPIIATGSIWKLLAKSTITGDNKTPIMHKA
jgi:hypothetical protein